MLHHGAFVVILGVTRDRAGRGASHRHMRAIQITRHGGPERLVLAEVPAPEPGPREARVRVRVAGVNFIDVYHRTGLYPIEPPFVPGMEGAGVVDVVGGEVTEVAAGDRVAWAMWPGSYAELAVVDAWKLVPIPPDLDFEKACAAMLQGMTAHYLARSTFPLAPGQTALVHSAAGGVGALLCQIARLAGARVLGAVSTAAKAEVARAAGCDEVIVTTDADFLAECKRLTAGEGVHVVYDAVGKDTFEQSLQCLRHRGMLVLYGQSSGPVPPFDLRGLAAGALFLTRPSLHHYSATRDELLGRARDVLGWIERGELELRIDRVLPLGEAAEAHRLLEGRATAGKLLLVP